jgi:hypothetical protein
MKIKKEGKKGEISSLGITAATVFVIFAGIILINMLPEDAEKNVNKITGLAIAVQSNGGYGGYGGELGDAPDSTNHFSCSPSIPGTTCPMTAYPRGGPLGTLAQFPTVWDTSFGMPYGPCHNITCVWLGYNISDDDPPSDADMLPDDDRINNTGQNIPNLNVTTDTPDQDFYDDGLIFDAINRQLNMTNCTPYNFTFNVTVYCSPLTSNYTFNAWLDWNRDGDWNDIMDCNGNPAPEWAVQNQKINLAGYSPVQTITFRSKTFLPYNPEGEPIWMRMVLHPDNTTKFMNYDGSMNNTECFDDGETEDYYHQFCQDKDGDGFAGNTQINCGEFDCDDNNAEVHPRAEEICDGIDNNCDGLIDEVQHEPCNDMISYWRLDDPVNAIAPAKRKSSTCLYDVSFYRHEGIGRPRVSGAGLWKVDFSYWKGNLYTPWAEDKYDIDPDPNLYHAGGQICYIDHALEGIEGYDPPPPIIVWGNLSGPLTYADSSDKSTILNFEECKEFEPGYYAFVDAGSNYKNYLQDCSNPPYGRPQFTIGYRDTFIHKYTAIDYSDSNHGILKPGKEGVEECRWPGCWSFSCSWVLMGCAPSETPWQVYEYDPWDLGACNELASNWGICPQICCAPCPPDCIIVGNTLPPQWIHGHKGCYTALRFAGDGDYMQANLTGNIPAANKSQTIAFWYKIENILNLSYQTIFSLYNQSNQSAIIIGVNNNSLSVWTYNQTFLLNTSLPATSNWTFVAYTFNETMHRLYVDGIEADNSTAAPDAAIPNIVRLAKNWTTEITSFEGGVDDVAIWNEALSSGEIWTKFNNYCTYCGTDQLCNDAALILWDETDERNLPYAGQTKYSNEQVKSFTNYTLIYVD